jgi:Amt family ammonium transporter
MRKLIASLALGLALLGIAGAASAQSTAASAPAAAAAAAPAADAASAPAAAAAASAPTVNKGDTAWMLVSTALVIMMSIPGLALFYGGLVRSKNMLSMLMQVMVTFSLIVVIWCIYGYSLAFSEGNAFFGGFDRLFRRACSIRSPARSPRGRPSARAWRFRSWYSSPSRRRSPRSPAA